MMRMAKFLQATPAPSNSIFQVRIKTDEIKEDFKYPDQGCWTCNGYYGSSVDDPLCIICHSFLIPMNVSLPQQQRMEYDDGEDSGNDEPPTDLHLEPALNQHKNHYQDYQSIPRSVAIEYYKQLREMSNEQRRREERETENTELATLIQILSHPAEVRNPTISDVEIGALPVEVLIHIFSYLDDISLWVVSEVSKQWKEIVEINSPETMWKRSTRQRWPLYVNKVEVKSWFKLYSSLMNSSFCKTCLLQIASRKPPDNQEGAQRLMNELKYFTDIQSDGVQGIPLDNYGNWQGCILGPPGSPYEGGKFFVYLYFSEMYPFTPPTLRFLTKIFHPNVSRHGDVGIDTIQHNWSVSLTILKLLLSVQSLLTDPYTEVCMEPILGIMYDHERDRFERIARKWTKKYAMFELLPPS